MTDRGEARTCAQRRQYERQVRDPHGAHPFQRFYLGPTPVSSQAAASVAHAIAEDVKITKPMAIRVAGRNSAVVMRKISQDSSDRPMHAGRDDNHSISHSHDGTRLFPSKAQKTGLSPLRIPHGNKRSQYTAERPGARRQLSREASFTSARSMPESVLSEGDLQDRRGEKQGKRGMRRDASAMADLHHPESPFGPSPASKKGKGMRRRESQSSYEPSQPLGRRKLSFDVAGAKDRRGHSEGPPAGGSILQHERVRSSEDREVTALPLLDLPVSEEEHPMPSSPPNKSNALLYPLRPAASHRSMDQSSATGTHATEAHAPGRDLQSSPAKHSDVPPSIYTDVNTSGAESARLQRMKERARKRYLDSGVGQLPSTQSIQPTHARDPSRQSRMSRASTAGTFASIGTRFSDGSFGATGGVRSRLVKKFAGGTSKAMELRARDIRLDKQRQARRGSNSHMGGVVPGAVGTSAGGTKWVGQSFEVGRRFWEMVESREEELDDDVIDEAGEEEYEGGQAREKKRASMLREQQERHSRQASQSKSPDDILDTFVRQAQDANDEQASVPADSRRQTLDTPSSGKHLPTTPALTFAGSDSDHSRREPQTPPKPADDLAYSQNGAHEQHARKPETSQVSLISVPHERGAEHESTFDIENRQGWSDVVSMMSAQSSAKDRSRGGNELSQIAKKALDGGLGLDGLRARQKEKREKQHNLRLGITRSTIREASNGDADGQVKNSEDKGFHEQTTTDSPQMLSPAESRIWPISDNNGVPPELMPLPTSKDVELANERPRMPSILNGASVDTASYQRKSVQFQGTNNMPPPASRGFGTSFFMRNSPTSELESMGLQPGGRTRHASSGDAAPAPPEEVLSRNDTPDGLSTPQLTTDALAERMVTRRSVLKRDRMLVQMAWSPSEDLPREFNERESRKYPVYSDPFREFMVVYRTGRLELWEDPSFVSRCLGHGNQLKLHAATSLKKGRSFVSMYSPIDRIFCLTFIKDDDSHQRFLDLRRSGTCIWIFDARSMSVGADWMWELCRELGNSIPDFLDVHLPALGVRVRIPIPEEMPEHNKKKGTSSIASATASYQEAGEGYKLLSRQYVKRIVRGVIEKQEEWRLLCDSVECRGLQFELAWRNETTLDWIKEDFTAEGHRRDWAVLAGGLFSEFKKPSMLEYRPAAHYPTTVRMPTGETLHEPPGIEGFLWRVKAVSGALTRVYITTHDGLIFVNRPSKAFPPDRHLAMAASDAYGHTISDQSKNATSGANDRIEGERRRRRDALLLRKRSSLREESLADLRKQVMSTVASTALTEDEIDAQIQAFRAFEKRRQFEQINNSDGYVDVRDIVLISSLDGKGPTGRPSQDARHNDSKGKGRDVNGDAKWEEEKGGEEGEEEDLGGEEGLALEKDRLAMKKKRQFEVVLSNGRSIRFEAYSKSVAKEWVDKFDALARYWKRREKVDALESMAASGLDPTMIGRHPHDHRPSGGMSDHSMGSEQVSIVLGGIWNWCLYHSCRGILKSGRLFQKKKAFAGFASRYYILIAGRLLSYKLMTSNRTARARQNSGIFHKRQETVVHLRDAYVYSGKLTEDMLVNGRSEGAGAISSFGGGSGGASSAGNRHILPRVYGDGLLSVDDDEDCTFVIRYRPQRVNQAADPKVLLAADRGTADGIEQTTAPASSSSVPTLGDSTFNLLVLRTRSKLERDLWVRAINIECERLAREDRQREAKIRDQGQTPWKPPH